MQTHTAVLELALAELLSNEEEFIADTKNVLQRKLVMLRSDRVSVKSE